MAELLLPQFVSWSRWWAAARQFDVTKGAKNTSSGGGLYAPGSTRRNQHIAIACTNQSPTGASRCETGLDNVRSYSPLASYIGCFFQRCMPRRAENYSITEIGCVGL